MATGVLLTTEVKIASNGSSHKCWMENELTHLGINLCVLKKYKKGQFDRTSLWNLKNSILEGTIQALKGIEIYVKT